MTEIECHPHVPSESAHLFSAHDGGSTEIEYLELLTALVCATKPVQILETGTYFGKGTKALVDGCSRNGFGHVYTIDILAQCDPVNGATHILEDSLKWLSATDTKFDFAFFDSSLPIRPLELKICVDRGLMSKGSWAVFHDTSRERSSGAGIRDAESIVFWREFYKLRCVSQYVEFPLSRGLMICRL